MMVAESESFMLFVQQKYNGQTNHWDFGLRATVLATELIRSLFQLTDRRILFLSFYCFAFGKMNN